MTPGFAKTRSELPWLPYKEHDRVIINAHNFTPIWTPSVNGKNPVAAWVPSRDTAGNGTTTLTDLVGSNNGTLTNMDVGDWVADTGAGGVRALDFDATNDYVATGAGTIGVGNAMVSVWVYQRSNRETYYVAEWNGGDNLYVGHFSGNWIARSAGTSGQSTLLQSASTLNAWTHLAVIRTISTLFLFVNGSQVASTTAVGYQGIEVPSTTICRLAAAVTTASDSRVDDIRIFTGTTYDAADVVDLYASGLGRGVQA